MPQFLPTEPAFPAFPAAGDRGPATRRTGAVPVIVRAHAAGDDEPDTLPYPAVRAAREAARSARTLRSAGVAPEPDAPPSSAGTMIVTGTRALARRVRMIPQASPVSTLDPSLAEAAPASVAPDTDRSSPPDFAARASTEAVSSATIFAVVPGLGLTGVDVSATAPTVAVPMVAAPGPTATALLSPAAPAAAGPPTPAPLAPLAPPRPSAPSAPALGPYVDPRASGTFASVVVERPATSPGIASAALCFVLGVVFTIAVGLVATRLAPGLGARVSSVLHSAHGAVSGATTL